MEIFFSHRACSKVKNVVKASIEKTLEYLKVDPNKIEVSVMFASGKEIRELNNRTRNIDRVTDVLSYPAYELKPYQDITTLLSEKLFIGDMAICLEQAKSQAKEAGESFISEVSKLAVHSTLHLFGFDHIKDEDYEVMNKAEEEIKNKLKENKII